MDITSHSLAVLRATLLIAAPIAMSPGAAGSDIPSFAPVLVTDGVYVIYGPLGLPDENNRGFRNNVAIVDTAAGAVVLDPGGSAWAGEQIAAAVDAVLGKPVVAVFDSHAHGDHWLGNEGVRRIYPDIEIYAHPVMKARVVGAEGLRWLEQIQRLTNGTANGRSVVAPTKTVSDGDEVVIGGTTFRIHHPGHAHSDNDVMIEVVSKRVLFTGDIVRNGLMGLMEADSSFAGNVAAIDRLLAMDVAHYIPGHGPIGGRRALVAYRTYLDTLLGTVRKLYDAGLADYEMKPAVSDAVSSFRSWEGFAVRLGAHVSRAYLEVEAEQF
ncbi:MAG: MBL fold metallo-hydrolase [Chromatiaceae bacterium]|nr:MBL fold metallo-hydrolase [Chromatiaceae bacterium]